MLDGGFFTAALAFVGIVPAHRTPLGPDLEGPLSKGDSPRLPGLDLAVPNITRSNVFELDHNAKQRERTRCPLPPADTAAFVVWLREIGEFGELTQRRLLSLYAEHCENAFAPVSTRRLMLQIGECGVVKRRLSPTRVNGKYHSPTVYRVLPIAVRAAA